MYSVSPEFQNAIKNNARYIKAYFVHNGTKYDIRTLNIDDNIYADGVFVGTFIAKNGSITVNVKDELKLENETIDIYIGIKLLSNEVEYVPMGEYKIYEVTSYNEFKIIDNRYKFNVPFDSGRITYPTTILSVLIEACKQADVELITRDFPNKDILLPSEVFFGYEATCADVITAVAQASCTFAKITRDNKLELKWFNKVDFSIDLRHQKNKPLLNEKFGPFNCVVLAREPQNDNVYWPSDYVIDRFEFKISNNPILDVDRYNSILPIYDRINGFEYIPFNTEGQGYFHLDSGNIIQLQKDDLNYVDVIIMNHAIKYSGGVASTIETPASTKTQIDYSIGDSIDKKIYNTELIVDKVKGEIDAVVEETTELTEKTAKLNIKVDSMESIVKETSNTVFVMETGSGNFFDNCNQYFSPTNTELDPMPLGIDKTCLVGKDIVLSVDVKATTAIPNGHIGASFNIVYEDDTNETYEVKIYPGVSYLGYTLAFGYVKFNKRIWKHFKLPDKPIKVVNNLKIYITCKGEGLMVSRPKVEFGLEPTGFAYDMQSIRDNIQTINNDYTEISQTVGELSLQSVSTTKEIITIKGEQEEIETRLQSTEVKLQPTNIMLAVNEQLGKDGTLHTTKFILDKNGGHFHNGGIDITNNAGTKVFYADTNGNLILNNIRAVNGTFTGLIDGGQIVGSDIKTTKDLYVGSNIFLQGNNLNGKRIIADNNNFIDMRNGYQFFNGFNFQFGDFDMLSSGLTNKAPRMYYMSERPDYDYPNGVGEFHVEFGGNGASGASANKIYRFDLNFQGQANLSCVAFYVNGGIVGGSDKRFKENIATTDLSSLIEHLGVVTYDLISGAKNQLGVIAQDLLNSEFRKYLVTSDEKGYLYVNYQAINMALVQKVQLMIKENSAMQLEFQNIQTEIASLKAKIGGN